MKLSYAQLLPHLKNNLLPIYLITGNEPLLLQEARDAVFTAAKKQGFSEFQRYDVNKDFDWQRFVESSNTYSLFSSKICNEIKLHQKPNVAHSKIFNEYLENHDPDKVSVIITEKLDSSTQRSSWVNAINKSGAVVTIWPLDATQFKQWAERRLRENNLICDPKGLQFLLDQTEGNLLALAQEIEKLSLLFEGRITLEDISSAIADNARFDIFSCIDIIEDGNAARILRTLQKLKQEGIEATLILWAMTREIRTLIKIVDDLNNKSPWIAITKKHQIWEKRQPLIKKVTSLHTTKTLQALLLKAEKIDHMIKGLMKGNVWNELEILALGLSGNSKYPLFIQDAAYEG